MPEYLVIDPKRGGVFDTCDLQIAANWIDIQCLGYFMRNPEEQTGAPTPMQGKVWTYGPCLIVQTAEETEEVPV